MKVDLIKNSSGGWSAYLDSKYYAEISGRLSKEEAKQLLVQHIKENPL